MGRLVGTAALLRVLSRSRCWMVWLAVSYVAVPGASVVSSGLDSRCGFWACTAGTRTGGDCQWWVPSWIQQALRWRALKEGRR